MFRKLALAAAILAPIGAAHAHEYANETVRVEHPWARATPAGAELGAGYVEVTNTTDAAITLTHIESPIAARVELHDMSMDNGVMRMRALGDGIVIAPGETVSLAPGGKHIMLMGLKAPLVKGETQPITLHFDAGEPIEVFMLVEGLAARKASTAEMDHSGHGAHSMDRGSSTE